MLMTCTDTKTHIHSQLPGKHLQDSSVEPVSMALRVAVKSNDSHCLPMKSQLAHAADRALRR